MPGRTQSPPVDQFEILCCKAKKLEVRWGDVRYADYVLHNGRQWTRLVRWEYRNSNGLWVEIPWPYESDHEGCFDPS